MTLRTAVFCNDTWHPAELVMRGLAPLARDDFRFEWLDTPSRWQVTSLAEYDLVVLAKGNTTAPGDKSPWLTPAIEQAFVDHVHAGRGLFLLHAGTCYHDNAKLRAVTGGAFLQHPPPCPVTLELRDAHPFTVGVQASTLHDEHYEMILDDTKADVFLHTRSQHGRQPAGWRRSEIGRVCALTPGHTEEAWVDREFRKLLETCLRWVAGKQP